MTKIDELQNELNRILQIYLYNVIDPDDDKFFRSNLKLLLSEIAVEKTKIENQKKWRKKQNDIKRNE